MFPAFVVTNSYIINCLTSGCRQREWTSEKIPIFAVKNLESIFVSTLL